jgi:WD40 repeat protein
VHNTAGDVVKELQIPSRGLTLDYASCMTVVRDQVWCGLSSGGIVVYKDKELFLELPEGHAGPVSCIAWSERTETVWTGGGDHCIIGWSTKENKRRADLVLSGHTDWVRCLLVCNGRLWSGSDDKTIRIWPEGRVLFTFLRFFVFFQKKI